MVRAALLGLSLAGGLTVLAETPPDADNVQVLVKFIPRAGKAADGKVQFVAESCPACQQLHDPAYEKFNSRESILQLRVPRGRALELAFRLKPDQGDRVAVNDAILPTRREGDRLVLPLPPLWEDAEAASTMETDIEEPGLVVRVEHADPARRAGAYADGPFPMVERRAADNLTFAQREVIRRLKLGEHVAEEKIGTIQLMGFDTNYPAGHRDAPPHIHMHLRWPHNVGTQIGHYYLDGTGLLTENRGGIRPFKSSERLFKRGETMPTLDNQGRIVYAHTITAEGWLRIDRPEVGSCLLSPTGSGFHEGVLVDCGPLGRTDVLMTDDIKTGVMIVRTGTIIETFRYDPDTGRLLTALTAPPLPLSARLPNY
ncbi:hypothetical protein [Niveispirillum sp. BGYR6]|uniref:hypothetical protein n=1 Tax=Niveispirillum sp. BGYR6 TaxID=2971249 RepID=UPI0022B96ABC|nr:hypothetical protein [Niveispirillum sp. BGYR6]MDG5498078.1 hypothetical protein [Niveispirillum sp. BGYR6]